MAAKSIIKLGDPGLWKKCAAVKNIMAPQIGVLKMNRVELGIVRLSW